MSFSNLLMKSGTLRATVALQHVPIRQGHTIRGKRPGVALTLEQRLQRENKEDPELSTRVNIGFPQLKPSRSEQLRTRLAHLKALRSNPQLEKQARSNSLLIDLDKVQQAHVNTAGQHHLQLIADHYGIFEHLFGAAYFVPRIPLDIKYEIDDKTAHNVYNGNVISARIAAKAPLIKFNGEIDPITGKKSTTTNYWTLLATNPDAHFTDNNAEYLHMFIGNIPNGKLNEGELLVDYLPPFPPKGLGYQRFVFVLYKQEAKLDFSEYKLSTSDYNNLTKRTFRNEDFYRKYQDELTPAGLAFYQTHWDDTLTEFYHNVLAIKEPIYEYDFPKAYLADQKFFPLKQPFNLYMDKHRDIKQVNKEYLERKLAQTHPFDGPAPKLRFPNAHPIRGVPSWLKTEIRKERLGIGRVQDY